MRGMTNQSKQDTHRKSPTKLSDFQAARWHLISIYLGHGSQQLDRFYSNTASPRIMPANYCNAAILVMRTFDSEQFKLHLETLRHDALDACRLCKPNARH